MLYPHDATACRGYPPGVMLFPLTFGSAPAYPASASSGANRPARSLPIAKSHHCIPKIRAMVSVLTYCYASQSCSPEAYQVLDNAYYTDVR